MLKTGWPTFEEVVAESQAAQAACRKEAAQLPAARRAWLTSFVNQPANHAGEFQPGHVHFPKHAL